MNLKQTTFTRAMLLALASIGSSAHAIGLTVGDATLDISGSRQRLLRVPHL